MGKITGNMHIHMVDSRVRTTHSRLIIRRTHSAACLYYTLIPLATHISRLPREKRAVRSRQFSCFPNPDACPSAGVYCIKRIFTTLKLTGQKWNQHPRLRISGKLCPRLATAACSKSVHTARKLSRSLGHSSKVRCHMASYKIFVRLSPKTKTAA